MAQANPADDLDFELGTDVLQGRKPEQMLYDDITKGKNPAITTARMWLDDQLAVYNSLMNKGIYPCQTKLARTIVFNKISFDDLARALLRHYYQMTRSYVIGGVGSRPPTDIEKFLDLVMAHELIRKTVDKYVLSRLP